MLLQLIMGAPETKPGRAACWSLLLLLEVLEALLWPMCTGLEVLGMTTPACISVMSVLSVLNGYLRAAENLAA
jgi:hypothetical protein